MTLKGAIKQLVEMRENSMMPEVFKPYLDKVIETVSECEEPSVQPEQLWIPVTKRLPNREEYIQFNGLFIVSDGDRAYAEYFDIYDKKCFGEHTMYGFRADMAVTAWMPLPEEPYKPPTRSQYRRMQE